MSTKLIYLLLFLVATFACIAQTSLPGKVTSLPPLYLESGIYHYKNYSTRDYGADFQNWAVLQDKNGIMVIANGDGVLTYDGKAWLLAETPTKSVIRSMAMDDNGKIYVGALDDIGFMKKNNIGSLEFESLLPFVKKEHLSMGNIWNTDVNNGFAYFQSEIGMFCWNGERMRFWPWPNQGVFHQAFFWKNKLYTYEEGVGLMTLEKDQFKPVRGGDKLKTNRVYSTVPLAGGKILLATKFDGLYIYNGAEITPLKTQADAFLREKQIYTTLMLPDSTVAIGTKQGGVVILDLKGTIRSTITKDNGLNMNSVVYLGLDKMGALWICLDDGISRFEIDSPLRLYGDKMGLEGAANAVCRYNGVLYVASIMGLFRLQPAEFPYTQARFEKVEGMNSTCWDLIKAGNRMLIAGNEGLFELAGTSLRRIDPTAAVAVHVFKGDSSRIVIAQDKGLQPMKLKGGSWTKAGDIIDLRLDNIRFNETHPGKLWIATFSQGATLVSFSQPDGTINYDKPSTRTFGPDDGLPQGYIKINTIDNSELFRVGQPSDHYRFDYSTNRFYADTTLATRYGLKTNSIFPIVDENSSGRFLAKTKKRSDGKKEVLIIDPSASSATRVQHFDNSRQIESAGVFNYEENGVVWHGGSSGLVRQEFRNTNVDSTLFRTYLNKIILMGDSTFFQGIGGIPQQLTFPYASNSFRFEFTSTNFAAEEANVFQYKLEGYDKDWSEWTPENIKEYSRVWEGDYRFLVRSRNYGGVISGADFFAFVIAPPWFRSIYAYVFYLLAAGIFIWGLIRWRSRQLVKEKEALEVEVANQTKEIRLQNVQLEEQSEELKANAEQLKELDKLKSNFFINISHEFRTPLSLILSPLEKIIQDQETGNVRLSELERMHRNAKRLQQLINQLLDLAKLESGGMKLAEQRTDFFYFLRVLTASFESLAEIRNIQYDVRIPPDSFETSFDIDKVETVLYNLLSNAFKFTPDGGRISFVLNLPASDSELISITISDTGPGIPPAEVNKIFDRFYQIDSSSSREFEGSGIGLSLVKELVSLMKGNVEVESELGKGTAFRVSLPLKGTLSTLPSSLTVDSRKEISPETDSDGSAETKKEKAVISVNESAPLEALILLIEDNEDLRLYLKENLEDDYQIVVAENGMIGLEKALELIPDLILSDMMMPQMDGFTLCTKIREDERTSHIPFILLTARTTIESKLEGLELGADEYMTKPFNIKEIKVRMKNLLEQRKNLRKSFSREVTIQPKNISVTSVDERFLNHALAIMEAHLADEQFSVERFAEEIGMSRKNLLRKIKALTDQSVNEFIRNFRLNRAAQLIEAKSATVSEIAYQVGFNNLSYFSKCFKELFGTLPNEYASRKKGVEV